jgi:hypothetical protein
MPYIDSTSNLKKAILLLETERTTQGQLLKQEIKRVYEPFRPVNLLSNTIQALASSPLLRKNTMSMNLGLVIGILVKKIITGKSDNKIRKLIGAALQLGVINLMAQRHSLLGSMGRLLLRVVLHKKKTDSNAKNCV